MTIAFERPTQDDIEPVFDLLTRSDIAEYGEPDSELSDLRHECSRMDLGQDIWIVRSQPPGIVGYGAVVPSRGQIRFDVYTDPERGEKQLGRKILERCEERVRALAQASEISAHTFLAHVNLRDKEIFQDAGFAYVKSFYQMHIALRADLSQPQWPQGVSLRTAVPEEDDQSIYRAVQRAFERHIEEQPTFEQWREHMIRNEMYDPELWFLAIAEGQIVGTCLGIRYETEGWIRQFGVVPEWRGQGIAAALLQHAFLVFRARGYARAGLGMEAENARAMRLYERVGMETLRQYDEYQKVYPRGSQG